MSDPLSTVVVQLSQTTASLVSSPATGSLAMYANLTDHLIYVKNSGGTSTAVGSGGGGGGSGTLTSVSAGANMSFATITTTGSVALASSVTGLTLATSANFVPTSSAPALSNGASLALGTITSASVVGTNQAGLIVFTTAVTLGSFSAAGTNATASELFKITFSGSFAAPNGCIAVFFPAGTDNNSGAQSFANTYDGFSYNTRSWSVGTPTTASFYFNLVNGTNPWQAATVYKVGYNVVFY